MNSDNHVWALWNLTTGEYFTLRGISVNLTSAHGTQSEDDIGGLLLVLMYRTNWSLVDDCDLPVVDDSQGLSHPPQGLWRGHRFDVVTVEMIQSDEGMEWKDISDVVQGEIAAIAVYLGAPWAEAYKGENLWTTIHSTKELSTYSGCCLVSIEDYVYWLRGLWPSRLLCF